ncbi:hypothetical protein D9Q98_009207 [Chlorella vulgaris]|uniref:Uncharacterized protein n=1 Tax=Chlorella vulgaris TaxID=3077 RepID=A0A9D4YWW8_CHLVU|nr:hypothetical protein D9Q98_009207 [Chlorella vulgaris]
MSIRVVEALSGESTQEATNEAGPAVSQAAKDMEGDGAATPTAATDDNSSPDMGEVTLRTAPQDARFPTANQARRCYVAYNEYHRCINEKGKGHGDCKPHMRAFRSICPDEWIEKWQELREEGRWFGRF